VNTTYGDIPQRSVRVLNFSGQVGEMDPPLRIIQPFTTKQRPLYLAIRVGLGMMLAGWKP